MTEVGKKQVYRGRKASYKQHTATKKLFLTLMLAGFMLFLIPMISAAEWDNVKRYDKETKTVTIKNSILGIPFLSLDTISTIKLNTPLNYHVGTGYQKVAEFEIDLFDNDYSDAFKKMEFFDLRNNEEKFERAFDYKYLTTELIEVNDYENVCSLNLNGTKSCSYEIVGTHQEEKEVWKDLDIKILKKGKVIVGIFTEVQKGDYVEWIPTLFGKEIDEWASWQNSISLDATSHGGDTTTSLTFAHTCTGDDRILFVSAQIESGNDWITGVTYDGVAMTLIDKKVNSGPNEWIYLYYIIAPSTGNNNVVITSSDSVALDGVSVSYTGANQASQPDNYTTNGVSGTGTMTTTLTTTTDNSWVISTACRDAGAPTPSTGVTLRATNGNNLIGDSNGAISPAGNYDMTWTGSNAIITVQASFKPLEVIGPIVNLNTPINTSNITTNNINFGGVVHTETVNTIANVSLLINNVYNGTNTSGINNSNYTFTRTLTDGDYTWTYEACDSASECTNGTARSFSIDTVSPTLKVIYPNETITFHETNTNLSLNWSANDTNIDSCWYDWNGTNITVTCSDNQTNINITNGTNKALTFYVNDTFGQLNSSAVTWNYRLFLDSETYEEEVFEGLSTTFSATFLTNGSDITTAYLRYNNTNNLGTISDSGSNNFTVSETITAPSVVADTNKSFYWNITQGSLNYNLTSKNQTVLNLGIDDCTTNNYTLYNFTIRNEENLTKLSNDTTTARLNLQIYGYGTTTLIQEYNKTYSYTNPFAVCLSGNLSTGGSFSHDLQVQYEATGYVTELYHIQNETITSSNFSQNISLYDLNETDSQVFNIIFRDASFLPVEDALIKVYRKYVEENLYRVVEIPMTDKRGEALAHLFLNEVIYKFEVVKYGIILETFTDVIAVCQTPLVASCEIDLNAFSESITVPDYEEAEDFSFTLGYDNATRLISSTFTIPSGTIQTITLNVTSEDSLGTSVCTDSLLSSSGTLSCSVPVSFGNSTIVAKIYKAGNLQAQGQIKLDQDPLGIYGVNLVFLALFVMITLIGAGLSDNPIYTTIFLLVGVALLFALNLVANNGFIGATATILFIVLAVIIVIIKGSRRS